MDVEENIVYAARGFHLYLTLLESELCIEVYHDHRFVRTTMKENKSIRLVDPSEGQKIPFDLLERFRKISVSLLD